MAIGDVHHLSCGTMRFRGAFGGRVGPAEVVAHCLLVERSDGLLLVDTGFGSADIAAPERLGGAFVWAGRPALDLAEAAVTQVQARGFAPADVTDIVLTHMDLDHAGGLGDFRRARVHVHAAELAAARAPRFNERMRYVAAQWSHDVQWVEHRDAGDSWFGLGGITVLGDDVLLVPLHGHSRGHSGVAVRRRDGHWLLHAGDAYFDEGEVDTPPRRRRALTVFQKVESTDEAARMANQERLGELRAAYRDEITVFCAHDKTSYDALRAGA